MDVDLWLRLLAHGHAEFLPELVGGLRSYDGTKTSAFPERGFAEVAQIRKKYGADPTTSKWRADSQYLVSVESNSTRIGDEAPLCPDFGRQMRC